MPNNRALRTNMLPIPLFLKDAKVSHIAVDGDALVFHFASGFYMPTRDGRDVKNLTAASMSVHFQEGSKPADSIICARRIRWLRRRRIDKFIADVSAKGMKLEDLFFSRHTKSIIVEGKGKGDLVVQCNNVADISFEFNERHVKVYDTPIVNRSDVFNIKK
ncbi:MAG: hypothetical protein K6B65_02260 [Bacilli bacterium]|nr:hypothetical protein [Bacilli bacterium]